jgi:predicted PurR-regulated permease PerM
MSERSGDGTERRPLTVQIAPRTIVIAVLVVTAVWLLFRLTDFLLVLVFAILLATAIDQPVGWLQRRGLPRPLGIAALYVVLVALLALVGVVLVPLVATEVTALRAALPGYATEIESVLRQVGPDSSPPVSLTNLGAELDGHLSGFAGRLTAVGLEAGRTLVLIFVTLVVAFFLAAEPAIGARLLSRMLPHDWYARAMPVTASVRLRIGAWARGQVLVAVIFGLLMGGGLRLLGVPYATSLGTIAGVLEIFPYVGGVVTLVLASLMALTVGIPQLIGVVILYVVLVFVESHVLAPLLFGRAVGLPPIAILLALIAGVELLGIAGALLAVPVTVIIWVIAEELLPNRNAVQVMSGPSASEASRAPSPSE